MRFSNIAIALALSGAAVATAANAARDTREAVFHMRRHHRIRDTVKKTILF